MSGSDLHIKNAKKHKAKAITITVLSHAGVLLLCIFLIAFTIENPPPGEQFVAVEFADLGNVSQATGDVESEVPSEEVQEVVEEAESAEVVEEVVETEPLETQEISDIVVPEEVEEEVIEEVDEVVEEETVRTTQAAEMIANNSDSGGGSSGTQEAGSENEGVEDGKIEGDGVVATDYGSASLGGDAMLVKPSLNADPERAGMVYVEITVNSEGKVIRATFDPVKSDVGSGATHLKELAEKAARSTVWEKSAKPRRSGYMTFNFKLE